MKFSRTGVRFPPAPFRDSIGLDLGRNGARRVRPAGAFLSMVARAASAMGTGGLVAAGAFISRRMPHPRTVYPDQPKGVCRVCRGTVTAKRRRFFCSRECARVYSAVGNWNIARRLVGERDRYTCRVCGNDVKVLYATWRGLRGLLPHAVWMEVGRLMRGRGGNPTQSWWECDHIVTVAESKKSGKSPDHSLSNLRVLCCRCHDLRRRE